ncbi:SGNH/GDSL hydrolase family protein [Amycolatopsis sp. NPDC051128]|uniref:SGNH/GDSL hydrolase family protein n=1 Tax=Amycolatopsis sp. NPDC051128 TaxID=3155412 RepID=UPI00342BF1D6
MRRWRSAIARLSAVAMLASLLALVGGSPASADPIPPTNWAPVAIGSDIPGASYVVTDPSGGASVGCWSSNNSPAVMFKSFSSSGGVVQSPAYGTPAGQFCNTNGTVGKDGTVYMTVSSLNVPTHYYVQAWKNNSLVWQYVIPCSSDAYPTSMVMGANGNVYMSVQQGGSCSNGRIIGLSPTAQSGTNPPVPQVVMNIPVLNTSGVYEQGLAAYDDGLVLFTYSNALQYVPYSATSTNDLPSAIPVSVTGSYIGSHDRWFEADPNGTVFLPVPATTAQVNNCYGQGGLTGGYLAVTPANSPSNPPTPLTLYGCFTMHEMHPTPRGGPAMRYAFSDVTTNGEVERISANGWIKSIGSPSLWAGAHMAVDLNGDIALRNNTAPTFNVNGSSWQFPEIGFTLYSGATGEVLTGLALRGEHDTVNGPSYKWGGSGDLALAKNTVYVTARQCTNSTYCDVSTTKLYAFKVPGVDMDYPRGAILRHDESWKNYVAMGDSFSSGEGVEPFISGTNTSGSNPNVCHRSEGAYSKLLSGNPGTRLNLTGFRACSGAKTSHITGGWDPDVPNPVNLGEHRQDEALSSSTDVVTVSIGGNDIGFSDFVKLCLFVDCSDSAMNQPYFTAINNLGSTLSTTYDDILAKAPNAAVYVVGYPQVLPDPSNCSNPLGAGITAFNALVGAAKLGNSTAAASVGAVGHWLGVSDSLINALIDAGQVTFTSAEMTAGRNLTTSLDSKISATVSAKASSRLKYVDATAAGSPFTGRELCTANPYFNGLDVVNQPYSFHPNQLGQDAYRQLLLTQF